MFVRCIIVDDEPLALETLESYISDFPGLKLVAKCRDAFETLKVLKQESVELMFLDINMPKLSGISLIKSLENPPLVIFTTAYPQYAVEGFDLDATDYLLKPFSFERFVKAVNKAIERLNQTSDNQKSDTDFLLIKSDKRIFKVNLNEIKYIQSNGDYLKVVTIHKVIVSHQTLKKIVEMLPASEFIQIHKSYIVSLKYISFIEGNQVKVGDEFLPIGITFKENLLDKLNVNE
ncbi:MAG: DNA-binding response regulator [Bacteroidetes bacterium HGW-Bacteroidetes-17]|nr:MAG: DNA-binding response regulator [Bacteroidetes bacterium HGW-Bacteroidetes-17]